MVDNIIGFPFKPTTKKVERKRSEAEKIVKENDLTKIETLYNKLKQEKKRIKDLLK
jgi:hypothetical protein